MVIYPQPQLNVIVGPNGKFFVCVCVCVCPSAPHRLLSGKAEKDSMHRVEYFVIPSVFE